MIKLFFTILILISYGFSAQSNEENMWSFSLGQFDVNDTVDSSELRFEYLYGNNFFNTKVYCPTHFSSIWLLSWFPSIRI